MLKTSNSAAILKAASILVLAILLASSTAFGGTLKGVVTDHSDNSGLVNAVVTVTSSDPDFTTTGAITDETGSYEVKELPDGIYTVKFTYVGFTTFTEFDYQISGTEETTLNAVLVPSAINLQSISVTASRRPEKLVDAPASVSVVTGEAVADRATLTPTQHVKTLPGVDMATTGLNQSNVVVRGFNNIFSGAMLVLTDNRIARVPSLRFNAHNFIPTINEDIEQIELVSGPGSALYGPNSSNGVMHIITKSPFTSQGTTVSFGGGERELMVGSIRHAGLINENVAYKFSGQYYQGKDWEHFEPLEPDTLTLYKPSPEGNQYGDNQPFESIRDFDIEKLAADARLDFNLNSNSLLIINGGFNRASSIELTGLGAGQAIDWTYYYGQARYSYKDLFVQAFVNASDAGDTYLLNTGQLIVDKSKLWVAQIQHRYAPNEKLSFTYGIDGLFTRPQTDSTINGRNEDKDNINEMGAYVQSDYKLTEQLKFVGAIRADDNDQLEDIVFSPRAGLVFQPNDNNNLRLTYNRAFNTPDNNNLFLDILSARTSAFDLRVQGVPESGFHWSYDDNGMPQFKSQFAPYGAAYGYSVDEYIDFNDPIFTNVMWGVGRGLVTSGVSDFLAGHPQLALIEASLNNTIPTSITQTTNTIQTFSPDILDFVPASVDDIADIGRIEPTITQTFEFGYKGVIADRFQLALDVYATKKKNFIGPLTVETPNVFLNQSELFNELLAEISTHLSNPANATDAAVLGAMDLDNPAVNGALLGPDWQGSNNGTYFDELAAIYAGGAAQVPYGVFSPEEALDANTVMITYRNFGDITYYGLDLAAAYHLNHHWNVSGTYSYVTKNYFEKKADQVHEIHLNAPRHKFGFGVTYTNPKNNIDGNIRGRYVDAFNMASPFFGSRVDKYFVLDLNFSIDVIRDTRVSLTVQNVFDNMHYEFVGAPEIGRLAIMRVTRSF